MLNKKNNLSGFTLVELMVSIGIIAIISTMALANFKGHNNKNKVDLAAYKLASDIRRAQSFALSMKEDDTGNPPEGGWGVRFNQGNNKYIIYADKDNTGKYREGEDEKFQEIILENGVVISELNIGGATNRDYGYINHIPPNPTILINGAANEANDNTQITDVNTIEIIIANPDSSYPRTVKVNKFGLIDVE